MKSRVGLLAIACTLFLSLACAPKLEPISLPTFSPLPEVSFLIIKLDENNCPTFWESKKDENGQRILVQVPYSEGMIALTQPNAKALSQREKLRQLREDSLEQLCIGMGAQKKPEEVKTKQ